MRCKLSIASTFLLRLPSFLSLSLARLYVHTCDCLHCNDTARAVQTFISDYNVHEHQRALANANYTSYENSRKRRRNKPALANLPVIIYKFQWAPPIFFSLSLSACLNISPLFVRMTHVVSIIRTSIARFYDRANFRHVSEKHTLERPRMTIPKITMILSRVLFSV